MGKKHVAFIIEAGQGGAREYVKMLVKSMNKDKYRITVICHGELYAELADMGYEVYWVKMVREIAPWKDMLSLLAIMAYLKKNKIDAVYCHSSKAGVLGRVASRLLHIPNLYNPHGWSFNMRVNKIKRWVYIGIEKLFSRLSDRIIMISEAEYNSARSKKISAKSKLELVVNGVDLERFNKRNGDAFKESLNISNKDKVVGMIGRLTPQKAPQTIIEIARLVTKAYPDCTFILVGEGELRPDLEKMVLQANLSEKVILTGWVADPEKYISILDIGVLTSHWEGFGLILAEIMASGKPVVASKVDGIPYVVRHNKDGYLCHPGDVKAFADAILKLLNEETVYKEVSESAYKHARNKFDLKRVVREHEAILDSF